MRVRGRLEEGRGVGRKKSLGGFQSGVSKTAGGLEGTAFQTLKGISHFCMAVFTKLVSKQ